MEVGVLRSILTSKQMEVVEAADAIDPAKMAFCTKICSKIITSQFCIIILNHDRTRGSLIPNANVNMEYGLMLGFNKYILPFQRREHSLSFNVQGLDTIKYDDDDFERKAHAAISLAIEKTSPSEIKTPPLDQIIEAFLFYRDIFVMQPREAGDQMIASLVNRFGFLLCTSIDTQCYTLLGIFTNLRAEAIIFRMKKIPSILDWIINSARVRAESGITNVNLAVLSEIIMGTKVIIAVAGETEKLAILQHLAANKMKLDIEICTLAHINEVISG
jgi:hypothetical protein